MKKVTKVLLATLATVMIGVSVAAPASAASVNYVDYDKTTETILFIRRMELVVYRCKKMKKNYQIQVQ